MLYKVYISECSLGYCLACCGFWIQETANSVRQCFGCSSALTEKGAWQQNIVCLLNTLRSPTRKPTFTLKACVLIHRWMNEQHEISDCSFRKDIYFYADAQFLLFTCNTSI